MFLWIQEAVRMKNLDMMDANELDMASLCSPPLTRVKRYAQVKAYGNHWRCIGDDDSVNCMGTYDSRVSCMVESIWSSGSRKDYIGELRDILLMDYGQLNNPIILFRRQ